MSPSEPAEVPSWPAPQVETAVSEPDASQESEVLQEAAPVETQEPAAATSAGATLFGRVQVTISPVPDFDRLLNLDSALSRVGSVQSVTLADYAQEEVTFRIDLASPLSASDFASELSEAAGLNASVTAADGGAVSLRLA